MSQRDSNTKGKRDGRAWRTALVATAILSVVVACGNGSGTQQAAKKTASSPLVVDIQFDHKTADPQQMVAVSGSVMSKAMYDSLLTFRGTDLSKPQPDAASSYAVSADARTFTFTLRKDIKFSDGTPMTVQDVLFTYNRFMNLHGAPSFLLPNVSVSSPDSNTFVITSKQPNPAIPYIVTTPYLGILNSGVMKSHGGVDAVGADKTDTAAQFLNSGNSVGSGPYTLQSFSITDQVVLKENANYWGEKPAFNTVVLRNMPAATQALNVQKGQFEVAFNLDATQAQDLTSVPNVTVKTVPVARTFFILMNANAQKSPITSTQGFRDAVRYGIDYGGLVKLAGAGASQAPGIIPPMLLGALPKQESLQQDVAKAKAALAQANLKNPTVTLEYPANATGNGISYQLLAERVQSDLAQVGITINLVGAALPKFIDDYHVGSAQMILNTWGADYADPSDYLAFLPGGVAGTRANWPAGSDSQVEAAGATAAQAISSSDRAMSFQNLQKLLNQKSPFVPLIYPSQVLVSTKSVTNVAYSPSWQLDVTSIGVS
jgi:peptide/nickel transport system substrate-binding protein